MIILKRKMKYFISLLLSLALVMQWGGESVLTSAAVTDNVSVAKVETLIGSPITETEPQSLFAYLREILSTVVAMSGQLTTLGQQMDTVANNVGNLKATAGGGCYYTIYTKKPYLNGYKLKLTDRTTAKSCFITRDDDSGYWAGVVRVPLADNIYIEIIDATTGKSQGEVSTTAVTTSGYATINLDPLLLSFLNNLVNVDDSLALHLSSDSAIIQNDTYFPIIMKHVYTANHDVDKFLTALNGKSYASKTFDELLNNETDFVNAVAGNTAYRTVLSQQEFTDRLINNRSLLKQISCNNAAKTTANANAMFTSRILSSTLAVSQSKPGGQLNEVSGNLICLRIGSGTVLGEGDSRYSNQYADQTYDTCPVCGNKHYSNSKSLVSCSSHNPSCTIDNTVIITDNTVCYLKYIYTFYCHYEYRTITDGPGTCYATASPGKYCTEINVPKLVGSWSAGYYSSTWGQFNASVSAEQACENSVITYIDLDAED